MKRRDYATEPAAYGLLYFKYSAALLNPPSQFSRFGAFSAFPFEPGSYGAAIRLPDLRVEISQCGRHGQMHDARAVLKINKPSCSQDVRYWQKRSAEQ
jgi:hypothetical protein